MPARTFNFVFASGATSSNKMYVGPSYRAVLVVSNSTSWNANTGNASISVRCGLSTATAETFVDITSANVSTQTARNIYNIPTTALTPWMSIGFGTAVTGSATNNVDVIVFSNTQDI